MMYDIEDIPDVPSLVVPLTDLLRTIMNRHWSILFLLAVALGLFLVAGCDTTGVSSTEEAGTMTLNMTGSSSSKAMVTTFSDPASPDSIQEALVTISAVSVVPTADTSEGDSTDTGVSVLSGKDFTVDLVDLQAGLDTTLTKFEIPAGSYSQIRLRTAERADVTFDDGLQRSVMIASGPESGLKLNDPFTIDSAQDSVGVTLNWDVQEALKGNPQGNFVITPVIDATVTLNATGN
ncbi:MAG: DUF4382 domain-containing protein [Salinibacter sp.]